LHLPAFFRGSTPKNLVDPFPKILGGFFPEMLAGPPGDQTLKPVICETEEELLQLLRDRRDQLDLPHLETDHLAGLASGHTSKILSPNASKRLGPLSLDLLLGALALRVGRIEIVEDARLVELLNGRWRKRRRPVFRRK
jgi:hypothetical protein